MRLFVTVQNNSEDPYMALGTELSSQPQTCLWLNGEPLNEDATSKQWISLGH